jgi:hypothetical protein
MRHLRALLIHLDYAGLKTEKFVMPPASRDVMIQVDNLVYLASPVGYVFLK